LIVDLAEELAVTGPGQIRGSYYQIEEEALLPPQ